MVATAHEIAPPRRCKPTVWLGRVMGWMLLALIATGVASATANGGAEVFVQLGHRSAVTAVAVAPDGRRAASASADGTIKLWDIRSGREIQTLTGHQGGVLAVNFSPDGKRLVSGGRDRSVRIWNAITAAPIRTLAGHENIVLAVAFSPDGEQVISAGYDGNFRVWNVASGASAAHSVSQGSSIRAISLSRDGKHLALASDDGNVKVFRYPEITEQATLRGHKGAVLALSFGTGEQIASAGQDGSVRIWNLSSGRELRALEGQKGPVTGVSYSATGRWIASSGQDGVIRVWRADTGQLVQQLQGHVGEALSVAFAPQGEGLVSGGQDRGIHIWDVATESQKDILRGRSGDVRAIAHNAGNRQVAIAGSDGMVRVWDTATGKVIRTLSGHQGQVEALAFSPNGQMLASAGLDQEIRLWNWAQGELLRKMTGHQGAVQALAFAPDGRQLASAGRDTAIRIWNPGTGTLAREMQGHKMSVRSLAYSPDGLMLASASYDDTARLWDVSSGAQIRAFSDHSNRLTSIAFSPDGAWLITGSEDSTLRMHPMSGNAPARVLTGHTAPIRSIAIGADGQSIVSASVDGTLARWDIGSGRRLSSASLAAGQLLAATGGAEAGGTIWVGGDGGAAVVLSADGLERARLYGFADGGWASITPDGFFNASESGARYLNVRLEGEVYGLEQFTESFFRPDAVRLSLLSSGKPREEETRPAVQQADIEKTQAEETRRLKELELARQQQALAHLEAERQKQDEARKKEEARLAAQRADTEKASAEAARRAQEHAQKQEFARLEAERQKQDDARKKEELARLERERAETERVAREKAELALAEERRQEERKRTEAERQKPIPAVSATVAVIGHAKPQQLAQVRPAPAVEIVNAPVETSEKELVVALRIADTGGGVGDIRLYLNGTAVLLDATRNLAIAPNQSAPGMFSYRVKLVNGTNILKAIAFNADNSMQSADAIHQANAVFKAVQQPSIHALVVGIQQYRNTRLNLQYSVADAKLFAEVLGKNAAGFFNTVNIHLLVTPQETTKLALVEALHAIQRKVNPEDLFVFYVASHGTVDEGDYFLITSNVGATSTGHLRKDAIGQELLKDLVANVPATKKFIVLDTCNAGKLGEAIQVALLTRGMSEDTATKILSRAVGSTVLSAATSQQEALEGYKGHGIFTWIVAEGLRGNADFDKDGFVKTSELAEYVDANVPALAEKVYKREQFPIVSPTGMQFPLVRVKH